MADPEVDMDNPAILAMFKDWSSPVGEAILDATQQVEDTAKISAPVSAVGSIFAPSGYLKAHTRQSVTLHKDEQGFVMGLVGAIRYPYNFVANPKRTKDFTWNRGRQSARPGANRYLDDALNSLNGFVRYYG